MNLIHSLKPIYPDDEGEWRELVSEIGGCLPAIFWYGGAAFDSQPLLALYGDRFPQEARNILSPSIFPVLTDYASDIVQALKNLYENFDKADFDIQKTTNKKWFSSQLDHIDIQQMIPLTLFTPEELVRIRKQYPDFHGSVTTSVIPDDQWHGVFILAEYNGREICLFYVLIENRTFWHEVVEKYELNVELFCALRVGGKSGSWDYTHDPDRGKLYESIQMSKSAKPKIWIADDCQDLRNIWREIEPHERGFYGEMHFFQTNWSK